MSEGVWARVGHLFGARVDRDGQAAALEPGAVIDPGEPNQEESVGRRDRRLAVPRELLDQGLAQKVLHGWLQNRHQVLVPLTFRLGRMDPEEAELLVRFAAACVLNGSTPERADGAERWLRDSGAGEAALAAFRPALADPMPLSTLIRSIRARDLGAYAYAAAVVTADTRDRAGHLFANYVAARLDLPADAVRSIDRRYRR